MEEKNTIKNQIKLLDKLEGDQKYIMNHIVKDNSKR